MEGSKVTRWLGPKLATLFLLSLAAPLLLSGATAEDWRSFPQDVEPSSSASLYSGVYSPENAFDSDWDTFALLEANRCDGGSSDCQEEGQPYAELSFRFPVAENTSAIDFHLQAVLHDGGSPPEGAVAFIECEFQHGVHTYWQINSTDLQNPWDAAISGLGWTETADYSAMFSLAVRVPISREPSNSQCSANDEGEIYFRIYTTHAGNAFESDETAIYLFEVMEVCEGDSCHTSCESNDFGSGEDASNVIEEEGTIRIQGIEVAPGRNDFTGWAGELEDDLDFAWFHIPQGYTATIQLYGIEEHGEHYGDCPISTSGNDFDLYILEWESWSVINSSTSSWGYPETVSTNISSAGSQVVVGISAYDGSGPYELQIWLLGQDETVDTDGDGVHDADDLCPGTLPGEGVVGSVDSVYLNNGGTGYNQGVTYATTGGPGVGYTLSVGTIGDDGTVTGSQETITGGAGYMLGDVLTISGGGNDATVTVDILGVSQGCARYQLDVDGDGYIGTDDAFPFDINEWLDTDGDGVGNSADMDDDGDTWSDYLEFNCGSNTTDSGSIPADYENDGICDVLDDDDDDDGTPDIDDAFPFDRDENADFDGDGIGDNADTDDDGDGTPDTDDAFPLDADAWELGECEFISAGTTPTSGNQPTSYIISYETEGDRTPAKVGNGWLDWDLDGFDNSEDFFPTDPSRAVMPVCGTSFAMLSSDVSFSMDPGGMNHIDGMVVVDWDRDGDYDIIVGGTHSDGVDFYGRVKGLENTPQGFVWRDLKELGDDFRFWDPELTGDVDDIALMDMNGDGKLGLIVGTHGWTRYYNQKGWGELEFIVQDENPWADDLTNTQQARDIIVADYNNDGFHDWAINYRTTASYLDGWVPRVELFDSGQGVPGRPTGQKFETGEVKYHINWFDEDSDGVLDLLMCKYECTIISPTGVTQWQWNPAGDTKIWSSAFADYDGDGDYDLAIGTENGIAIFQMPSSGELPSEPTIILDNDNSRYLHWADIDGNGWLDLLSGNDGKDQIFGNFDGELHLVWRSSSNSHTNFIMTADIDLDGDLDIIGSDGDSVFVITNEPDDGAAFAMAMEILSAPYMIITGAMALILFSRSILMLLGRQEIFFKPGVGAFSLVLIATIPLLWENRIPEGTEFHPSVVKCGYNEACVASNWMAESPFFSYFAAEDFLFPPLNPEGYQKISGSLILVSVVLSLMVLMTLWKHHRKAILNIVSGTQKDEHITQTISSFSGSFGVVGVSLFFHPSNTLAPAIGLIFFVTSLALFLASRGQKGAIRSQVDAYLTKRSGKPKSIRPIPPSQVPQNYAKTHLMKFTVAELKDALRKIGAPLSGRKDDLATRLLVSLQGLQKELAVRHNEPRYRMYRKAYESVGGVPPEDPKLTSMYPSKHFGDLVNMGEVEREDTLTMELGLILSEKFQILGGELGEGDAYFAHDIPERKLRNARRTCKVPSDEDIGFLWDSTAMGSAKNSLVFTTEGIYFHNGYGAAHPGAAFIPLNEFVSGNSRVLEGYELEIVSGKYFWTFGRNYQVALALLLDDLRDLLKYHGEELHILDFDDEDYDEKSTPVYDDTQNYSEQAPAPAGYFEKMSRDEFDELSTLEQWLSLPHVTEAETGFNEVRRITPRDFVSNFLARYSVHTLYLKFPKEGYEEILRREIRVTSEICDRGLGKAPDTHVGRFPRHAHVGVKIHYKNEDHPFMVLENAGSLNLVEILDSLDIGTKVRILVELARDISRIHGLGFVHRDIKPQNIMIRESYRPGDPNRKTTYCYRGAKLQGSGLIDFGSTLRINRRQSLDAGGQTRTKFFGHKSQEKGDFRAHEGQDWYSFGRTAMAVILSESSETLSSMIQGNSAKNRINRVINGLPAIHHYFTGGDPNSDHGWDEEKAIELELPSGAKEALRQLMLFCCTPDSEENEGLTQAVFLGKELLSETDNWGWSRDLVMDGGGSGDWAVNPDDWEDDDEI